MSADLIAIAVRYKQSRSKTARTRALQDMARAVDEEQRAIAEEGRCTECGYKTRTSTKQTRLVT